MKIPAFARLVASVTALTLAAPTLAQDNGSVTDFELPTAQASPRGDVQGPVVDGVAPPRDARPSPTPSPTPRPAASTAPVTVAPPPPLESAEAVASAIDNFNAARTQAASTEAADETSPEVNEAEADEVASVPAANVDPAIPLPQVAAPETANLGLDIPSTPNGSIDWLAWLGALIAVGGLGIGVWLWRGRQGTPLLEYAPAEPATAPDHVREPVSPPAGLRKVANRAAPNNPPTQHPIPAPPTFDEDEESEGSDQALRIALEPARLSVSLMNATLSYRILLTNQGGAPLRDISIDGDMISAHASLPEEDQIAASNSKLENRHVVRTLFPGETKVVSGDFALPLSMIRPIRNGNAALFVPLARLRVVAGGELNEVIVQTSVVGQRSERPGGGLQPFRLDLGPRIYSELAQRAFA